MGYYGSDGFIFAWDLDVSFLGIAIGWLTSFKRLFFLNFGLKGVIETCVGCFLVYLFLRVFLLKSVGVCNSIEIALLPYFNN